MVVEKDKKKPCAMSIWSPLISEIDCDCSANEEVMTAVAGTAASTLLRDASPHHFPNVQIKSPMPCCSPLGAVPRVSFT